MRKEAEIIVVGSGAGGATVARELARRGKKVLVLEKGKERNWAIGRVWAYLFIYDILRTREGVIIRRGITPGGSTVIYSGNSFDPPEWLKDEIGIDISKEVQETKKELGIKPLPEEFYKCWEGERRLVESAGELGINMTPQEKFINPDLCDPSCDSCLFGCSRGAKWTARSYLKEAQEMGAELISSAEVKKVLIEGGKAVGVLAQCEGKKELEAYAEKVILCAGGVGTPWILQASGIKAGEGFFTDPMSLLLGVSKNAGTFREMTFSYASADFPGKFMIGTTGALNSFFAQLARLNFKSILRLPRYKNLVGMFVKLCDQAVGKVEPDGKISKPLTQLDHERKEEGIELAKKIMIRAGVEPDSILVARYIGGHPGGSAGIGRVVNSQLESEVKNLYVCDASVLPRSLGIPLVLTLVALAKKFTREILM